MNADDARRHFRETFGTEPDVIASAPGRVNLIGEHLDYNGGQVLPMGIDRRTYVALKAKPDAALSRAVAASQAVPAQFDIGAVVRTGEWGDYVTGICAAFSTGGAPLR